MSKSYNAKCVLNCLQAGKKYSGGTLGWVVITNKIEKFKREMTFLTKITDG
jgi:hypothetical protein